MSELVQGVKLKFELPFKLPAPVSFPFESIGDFRPITRIPKYDYSLEKKIMKEIAKQKQEDQFNMLKQAQQQLSMVDLIASRKYRHKGKEPERSGTSASSGGNSQLLKPSSEGGVSRLQSSASVDVAASPLEQHSTQADALSETPASNLVAVPTPQVERPHSAGPGVPIAHSSGGPISAAAAYPQTTLMAPGTATAADAVASVSPGTSPAVSNQPLQRPDPTHYPAGPHPHSPVKPTETHRPPMSMADQMQRPTNVPPSFAMRPSSNQPLQTGAMPAFSPGAGTNAGLGFQSMVELPLYRPQQQRPQIPMQPMFHSSVPIRPGPSSPGYNSRFSTSFGLGPPANNLSHSNPDTIPLRPALPPKPDEWKPLSTNAGPSALGASTGPPPVPPRRTQDPQDAQPPALPPKPSAFTEFDYADGPNAPGSSESTDHVEQLNTLLSMGFSRPQAIHALEMYDYDVNKASNYLIDRAL